MDELTFALALGVWGLLPGIAVLSAAGCRWPLVERLAAAGGLSLAIVAFAAYAAEVVGLPVAPWSVGLVVLTTTAGIGISRRGHGRAEARPYERTQARADTGDGRAEARSDEGTRARADTGDGRAEARSDEGTRARADTGDGRAEARSDEGTRARADTGDGRAEARSDERTQALADAGRWASWVVLLLPLAVVMQLAPMYEGALLPPSLHDGLDHANWFRLIYETQSVNPYEVLAPPLTATGGPTFYPWGAHAWLAIVAQSTSLDPVQVFMRGLVATSALLPLSVFAFASHLAGRTWVPIGAATFSLFFWWLPYQVWGWGGYALLTGAMAAAPVTRLALVAVATRTLPGLAVATVCAVGVLLTHPSQAWLALVAATTVSVTLAAGRAAPWRAAMPFVLALAASGVAIVAGESVLAAIAQFLDRARTVGATLAGDPHYQWPMGVYFDLDGRFSGTARHVIAVLMLAGAALAIRDRALRPFVALHVVFSLAIPLASWQTWGTALWYHAPERIWYAQYLSLPVLAVLGVAAAVRLLTGLVARVVPSPRWAGLIWPIALVAIVGLVDDRFRDWTSRELYQRAHVNPNRALTILDAHVLPDFAWMRANVPAGDVVFNAPSDWGVALPLAGRRTVFWSGGNAVDVATDWNYLLGLMRRGGDVTAHAVREIAARDIRWIAAVRLSAPLRAGRDGLDRDVLQASPDLDLVYESPSALVFRIRDDGSRRLGLRDSEAIRFRGVHDVERVAGADWRWTTGDARLVIRTPPEAAAAESCFVRLIGPALGSYDLRIGGRGLDFTDRGFRVTRRDLSGADLELSIQSPEQTIDDTGRTGGVRLRDVTIACPRDR